MDLEGFENLLAQEPKYRLVQAKKALFQDLIENWNQAVALPLSLRERLDKECPLEITAKTFVAQDTVKALLTLEDGLKIETVLMRHGSTGSPQATRNTVCVSSQVGCPLGCSFCATGRMGFKRNLGSPEIVAQVLFFARYLKKLKEKVTNIVFMGMGEPFLNYQNVIGAIRTLNDPTGFHSGARHFSISTVGIAEGGIAELAKEKLQITLAVSLHAPNDELRSQIMKINEKYSIRRVLDAVDDYIKKTKRRVMFEYIMIKDVNDSAKEAEELAKLMKKPLYFVNLISYNQTGIFKPSSPAKIKRFKEILEQAGVAVTQRYRFGREVEGACGQLATGDKIDTA